MNQKRRKALGNAKDHIVLAQDLISGVIDEEQEALDNTPENLQESNSYYERESLIDELEDVEYDLRATAETISNML